MRLGSSTGRAGAQRRDVAWVQHRVAGAGGGGGWGLPAKPGRLGRRADPVVAQVFRADTPSP
jgi:hypothetical protein